MPETVLSAEQLGHLRHFDNLSRQLPNDWSLMQGKGTGQDDFGGYRFQLAYMAYALALTHRHRLPAAPGLFQPVMQRLIEKILLPEVWMYWRDVSGGGSVFNAHLAGSLTEQWDPVVRDNIMYSAYVQSMALLHDYLFDSDRYAAAGSLTFQHWSFFWGGPEKRFAYDRDSLNEHVYWQMIENGYLGVACEPNCGFQIRNQPAILGFRLHDLITGGSRAAEVVAGYERAWAEFGRLDVAGHYNMMVAEDSRAVRPNERPSPWVDAWCGALMNMWNRDFVRSNYPRQVRDFLITGPQGTLSVPSAPAREVMSQPLITDTCDFGWKAAWAAEMGNLDTLHGLLEHAERFMGPAWRDGGLYYPRNDTAEDKDGNWVEVEPMTGNVLLGYARLNVPDGLWGLYNQPWDRAHFEGPALTAVERDVEVSRAEVADGALRTRLRRLPGLQGEGTVTVSRVVGHGRWTVSVGGQDVALIDGGLAEPEAEPGPAGTAVRVAGSDLILRCAAGQPQTFTVADAVTAPVTPAFTLVDDHGSPVSERTYRGRWMLAFFGFTHCRAVCPRALRRLSDVLDTLGETAGQVKALYITVDPERDTPQVMREFLRAYPRFTGLTGTADAVEEVKKSFRVFARRKAEPADPGGYAVPHTAITYLISPDGEYADHFADALPAADVAARLQAHLTRRP